MLSLGALLPSPSLSAQMKALLPAPRPASEPRELPCSSRAIPTVDQARDFYVETPGLHSRGAMCPRPSVILRVRSLGLSSSKLPQASGGQSPQSGCEQGWLLRGAAGLRPGPVPQPLWLLAAPEVLACRHKRWVSSLCLHLHITSPWVSLLPSSSLF